MSLSDLLGSVPTAAFIEQHYLKLPFALNGGCRQFANLGSWESVERILGQPGADTLVVKSGEQRSGPQTPSYAEARALHADGYTIVLRHVERRDPIIASFAAGFMRDLLSPLDVHIYCTPASQFGFGWHYDAEDVFILQSEGCKEYSLRKNTVNPWPVLETMPNDMGFQREIMPLMKCTLSAGDWLYIPGGYWHRAQSREDSISVAIGVMATTALDVLDFVRQRLPGSLVWRQRLPVMTAAAGDHTAEARSQFDTLCEQLGRELMQVLANPRTAADFIQFQEERLAAGQLAPLVTDQTGHSQAVAGDDHPPTAGENSADSRPRGAASTE
jgi:50S ribosomal protein L16 3-hydroxylase